jgi:hypothetical protein
LTGFDGSYNVRAILCDGVNDDGNAHQDQIQAALPVMAGRAALLFALVVKVTDISNFEHYLYRQ